MPEGKVCRAREDDSALWMIIDYVGEVPQSREATPSTLARMEFRRASKGTSPQPLPETTLR